ncbi:hypothetical protein [Streptomyces sp. NPDC060035]|uniref:RipA family octameric membrane protein n=1 Tax=Streptomyces sp. NPDC060035 TaxID=3347044 RepID=UPI0036A14D98
MEMADRISTRRGLTNSFFLTLNLAAISTVAALAPKIDQGLNSIALSIVILILCGQCFVWFHTLRSYRLLNKAKYAVIEVLEEKLPARAYSQGEWHALVRSGQHGKYLRLTSAEQSMPLLFTMGYAILLAYMIINALSI